MSLPGKITQIQALAKPGDSNSVVVVALDESGQIFSGVIDPSAEQQVPVWSQIAEPRVANTKRFDD